MGNRIVGVVLLVLLCVGIYEIYQHYRLQKADESGVVHCVGCMSPEESARFKVENSGEGVDGQSEHKRESAQQTAARLAAGDATAATPGYNTANRDTPGATPPGAVAATTPTMTPTQTMTGTAPVNAYAPAATTYAPVATAASVPDSQAPNAPNGVRFGVGGNYQWYRQGNLTYRIDTTNGRSCVAYATLEEWRKQIVMSHGCGRAA